MLRPRAEFWQRESWVGEIAGPKAGRAGFSVSHLNDSRCSGEKQIPRFARNDNLAGVASGRGDAWVLRFAQDGNQSLGGWPAFTFFVKVAFMLPASEAALS